MSTPTLSAPRELTQVVEAVFQTMLHLPVEESLEILPVRGEMVTAAVHLTGAYQGAVLLHCAPWQACGLAAQFLGKTPPSSVDDEVLDVIGELANMVAGNLKCTLLPGTHLSIPAVYQGMDSALRLCGGRPTQRRAFRTPLGPVWVTMVQSTAS
jgi:chemotaxis protein CheX